MISKQISDYINRKIGKFKINKLHGDMSSRQYFRIINNEKSFILMNAKKETRQYNKYLKISNLLKNINISIPKIYDFNNNHKFILLEDFGDITFNKIINNDEHTDNLFKIAIKNLIILKNSNIQNKKNLLVKYNFKTLEKEITEFIDWYYPFITRRKMTKSNKLNFIQTWHKTYKKINLNFDSFVHKDFFSNNLMYLPKRNKHLKCGIIDFQDACYGDQTLDLVSLFEDSRRIIKNNNKKKLIKFYLNKTNQKDYDHFISKMNFIGASRQTRILGRWIKLYKIYKKQECLNYINNTWYWLEKNLNDIFLQDLKKLYLDIIPKNKRKYEN